MAMTDFVVSEHGKVTVLQPDGSLKTIAVNDLDDLCNATPAIGAEGRICLRTRNTLYCFGETSGAGGLDE